MVNAYKKYYSLIFLILIIPFITGCEEQEEDVIIGTWTTTSFEKYENLDCTGSLESTSMPFGYTEIYEFKEDSFTWSTILNNGSNTTMEEGSYTLIDSIYTLTGEGTGHGKRRGQLISETSMFIKLQWDDEEDLFYLLDTCYKIIFDKN